MHNYRCLLLEMEQKFQLTGKKWIIKRLFYSKTQLLRNKPTEQKRHFLDKTPLFLISVNVLQIVKKLKTKDEFELVPSFTNR